MENLNYNLLTQHHRSVLNANKHPYGYCSTSNFFPREVIQSISTSFKFPETIGSTSDVLFQKTKRALNDYNLFPNEIKQAVDYLNSQDFINILEEKFKINNLVADPALFGGGMHESRNGGYLKFIQILYTLEKRNSKNVEFISLFKQNWDENRIGAIELWDQKIQNNFLKIYPKINHA